MSVPRELLVDLYAAPNVARDAPSAGPLLRAIVDQSPVLTLLLNPDGTILHCNRLVQPLLGYAPGELIHGELLGSIAKDDQPRFREHLQLLLRGEASAAAGCELRLVARDGRDLWFDCRLTNLLDQPEVRGLLLSARDLTDQKTLEQQVRDSELRFETVLWGGNIAYWDYDLTQQSAKRSAQWFEMTGWSPQEWYAEAYPWAKRIHPEDLTYIETRLKEHLAGSDDRLELEYRVLCANGSWRWMVDRGRIVERDATGRPRRIIGTSTDIDARKRAEQHLVASTEQLRAVTESVPDLLLLTDLEMRVQFANRPMLGHEPQQLVGRSILELLPEDEREPVRAVHARALATRRAQVYESRHVIAGEAHWFENRVGLVLHEGQPTGLTVSSTEVTVRRRGEEALKIQARILDAMREGVLVLDSASVVRLANGAVQRLSGYQPRELIGRPARLLTRYSETQYQEAKAEIDRQLAEAEFCARDIDCMHRDGTSFTAGCVITPIAIGGEAHRLVVLEDVTQRRELEREIIDIANREQRRIGSDLHDGLGQELTGVALMLSGLVGRLRREHPPAAGDAEEIVTLVNSAIDGARALARGVSPVSVERGGLSSALRALASRATDMYGVTVRFRGKVWPQLTLDAAACDHLFRIAQEAVNNAVKHGRAGQILIDLHVTTDTVTLTVRDNGSGLASDAQLSRGMGLKIMHYRASILSGSVVLEPVEGGGLQVVCRCRQPPTPESSAARS
ncbi:MAG TPA: PAS domain S-box protein [Steroidobacteraceae bacterium]|nr:PAS domain S-box protein [Steroidobacteraceae bacterium]